MDSKTAAAMILFIEENRQRWTSQTTQDFLNQFSQHINKPIEVDARSVCFCDDLSTLRQLVGDTLTSFHTLVIDGMCPHATFDEHRKVISVYPIHLAAVCGVHKLLRCLVSAGADLYKRSSPRKLLAFDATILRKDQAAAQLILDSGFSYPDAEIGNDLFSGCVSDGDARFARYLVHTGNFSPSNYRGHVLGCLSAEGAPDVSGAFGLVGIPVSDAEWAKAVESAVSADAADAAKWLLELPGFSLATSDLDILSVASSVELLDLLMDHGADPRESTALPTRLRAGQLDLCDRMLERFPDAISCTFPAYTSWRYTLLHHACCLANRQAFDLCLRYNADCHVVAGDGNTPLSLACEADSFECAAHLLALGCDPNTFDKDDDTSLLYACLNGNSRLVRLLLECGADPHAKNREGATALWNAAVARAKGVVEQLVAYNVDLDVLTDGVHIHYKSKLGRKMSLLMVCLNNEDIRMLMALISAGYYPHRELSHPDYFVTLALSSWLGPDRKRWLDYVKRTPMSLAWWCKRLIRQRMGRHDFKTRVNDLDIDDECKSYIIYNQYPKIDLYNEFAFV